jgi:hypothetical protein
VQEDHGGLGVVQRRAAGAYRLVSVGTVCGHGGKIGGKGKKEADLIHSENAAATRHCALSEAKKYF